MKRRGFTLMELMIVLTILPLLMGAIGAMYLEGRVATARVDSQVRMTMSLSLAHEIVARDLRGATKVTVGEAVDVTTAGGAVRYTIVPEGLVRTQGRKRRVIAPRVTALDVIEQPTGYRVLMTATRRLIRKRKLTFNRTSFVSRRL